MVPVENADEEDPKPDKTISDEQLEAEVRQLISGENGFRPFERIRVLRKVPEPFEVGKEMTNLFKLRRHVIEEKYRDLIDEMFNAQRKQWK